MFEDLNSKISNITVNNPSSQVEDNKISFLTFDLNNNSIGSKDYNIDNSYLLDNFSSSNNDISFLEKPLINQRSFEKNTKTNTNNEKISHSKGFINLGDNQSNDFKRNKESHKIDYDINELIQLRHSLLNKKRKNEDCKGRHSKYAEDNLRRKIKNNILNYALEFINKKVKQIYNEKIGNGIFKKQLLPINQIIKSNMSQEFIMNLLPKTLGEIFSDNISCKYTNYSNNHNKIIIDKLLHDKNENIASYFKNLFNITFSQCLDKFRGSDEIKELDGFTKFNEIKCQLLDEFEYIETYENFLNNYELKLQKKPKKMKIKNAEGDKQKKSKNNYK